MGTVKLYGLHCHHRARIMGIYEQILSKQGNKNGSCDGGHTLELSMSSNIHETSVVVLKYG